MIYRVTLSANGQEFAYFERPTLKLANQLRDTLAKRHARVTVTVDPM